MNRLPSGYKYNASGKKIKTSYFYILSILSLYLAGCQQKHNAHTAFYYWKTTFRLDQQQKELLNKTSDNRLFLHFFDVTWNEQLHEAIPNGVIDIRTPIQQLKVSPVVYITNQTFQNMKVKDSDSLAFKVNKLLNQLVAAQHINYTLVQIDCDWTVGTREKYFSFLKAFKRFNGKQLQATIRLHQIKYPERTGVPPVDKGLLMFYNMGNISAGLNASNSIYNKEDAAAYTGSLTNYRLPLDVALPAFSWAIQIRGAEVVQLYGKIGLADLAAAQNFEPINKGIGKIAENVFIYKSRKSFYIKGIYIKKDDLFKLETMDAGSINQAAAQLTQKLSPLENRNIIYYELSSISTSSLYEKDIRKITAHF